MNRTAAALCLAASLVTPGLALAREITLTTRLASYGGDGAYVAVYLTDAQGAYQGTLWLAGGKAKYYKHLPDWYRATGGAPAEYDGLTGASVGAGRTLTVTVDLADALIDAGYQIRIDTSVEDMRDNPSEIVAPLTSDGAGVPIRGRGYVDSFTYDM